MPERKQRSKQKEAAKRRKARTRAEARRRASRQREKRKQTQEATSAPREPVRAEDVRLEKGKGTRTRGGGEGGFYWHIHVGEERVGHIYINMIDEQPFGRHASIQIFLNKNQRGRQIGRVAYRIACEASGLTEVYAHMRKSNLASKRAAEAAGFVVVENETIPQLAMVWQRLQS